MTDPLVVGSIRGGQVEAVGYADRNTYTVKASTGVATGGRFVDAATGSMVVDIAGAGSTKAIGLACHDAAAGAIVTVAHEGIWFVRASGAINNGDRLITGALGVVVAAGATPDARTLVGIAQEDAADGTDFRAKLSC